MTTVGYNEELDLFLEDENYKGEPWKKETTVEVKCQYCNDLTLRRFKNLYTCEKCKTERYKHHNRGIRKHTCTICRMNIATITKYCEVCTKKLNA